MRRRTALIVAAGISLTASADDAVIADWANELARAHRNKEAIPVLSDRYTRVDKYEAYKVQAAYVRLRQSGDRVAGYKAATTSAAGQRAVGIRTPTGGVIFRSGEVLPDATIRRADFGRLMVEVELGYRLRNPVDEIIVRIEDLKKIVSEVVPVIELPDAGYTDRSRSTANDFIAANALAAGFLAGNPLNPATTDPNVILVTLSRDGQVLSEATGDNALGDQWAALHWLVNHVVAQGYTISPNDLLITGLLGRPVLAESGDYVALYDDHEPIHFRVE